MLINEQKFDLYLKEEAVKLKPLVKRRGKKQGWLLIAESLINHRCMCPDTIRPGIRIKYRLESMLKKYKSNRDKNKHSSGIVQEVHDEQYEELLLQKEEGQLLEEHKDSAGIKTAFSRSLC